MEVLYRAGRRFKESFSRLTPENKIFSGSAYAVGATLVGLSVAYDLLIPGIAGGGIFALGAVHQHAMS